MTQFARYIQFASAIFLLSLLAHAEDHTIFQTEAPYSAALDIGSDMAVVYGVGESFGERVAGWRAQGYRTGMMTGIAWGEYGAYYAKDGVLVRTEEIQTREDGSLFMHGDSTSVGYNVPTPDYIAFIKEYIAPAIREEVEAIYFEEPEFWAKTGWSAGFKRAWQDFYGEPWQAPNSSADAQWRASKLKYELYFNALKEAMAFVDAQAAEKGIAIDCHVPTHSLVNYAHWQIVSPMSHLIDIPALDGYVAQVWTGTARTANTYLGVRKERTFDTAFFEYGQMVAMTRPTGKRVWFLADPVEDHGGRTWDDYKLNYEATLVASLLWPDVSDYEVMPWPSRIFNGQYAAVELGAERDRRVGIPEDYATELLTVINALNDMDQPDTRYDTGSRGIGLLLSDTMMFQRVEPYHSDLAMGSLYGLALPLFKEGIPLEVVQLENAGYRECLEPYRVLLLTYEHQKPLKRAYHEALTQWVRDGGALLYFGDGSDPMQGVREWWNEQGATDAKAEDDLFAQLGVTAAAQDAPQAVGKGWVRIVRTRVDALTANREGAELVRASVAQVMQAMGRPFETQNYIELRRGPYIVVSVLDESLDKTPRRIEGNLVDLFDPQLAARDARVLGPGERTLLYDVDYWKEHGGQPHVIACAARVRDEESSAEALRFTVRGPQATTARARVYLKRAPASIETAPAIALTSKWDEASSTLWIEFPNRAEDVRFTIR